MDKQVLVAYATKYGATAEIAEKLGEVLRQAGFSTDVQTTHAVETWQYVLRSLSVRFHILQRYLYAYKQVDNAAQLELRAIWDAVDQELVVHQS